MTTPPQPPVVPAPAPAHTINVVAPVKAPAAKAAPKVPLVGRPARSLPPGPAAAAAGTGAAAAGTGSWFAATVAGAPGFVGPAALGVVAVAGTVAYRRFRGPAARKRAGVQPRPSGPGTGRLSLVPRPWVRGGQPAAGGSPAPRRAPGGGSPTSPGRRRRFGDLLSGGRRRPPAGGSSPGDEARAGGAARPRGWRLARLMPGPRGRAARQAARQAESAGQQASPAGSTTRRPGPLGRVWARRPGAARRAAKQAPAGPSSPAAGGGPPAGGTAPPRTRAARMWARRPGAARRAAKAAANNPGPPVKKAPAVPRRGTGRRGATAPPRPGAPAAAGNRAGPAKTPAKTPAAKGPLMAHVWSTSRKDRRAPARAAVPAPATQPGTGMARPVSLKTGRHLKWWNLPRRTGSSRDHIANVRSNIPPTDPGKGGGVGPPSGKPKPAPGGGPGGGAPTQDKPKAAGKPEPAAAAAARGWTPTIEEETAAWAAYRRRHGLDPGPQPKPPAATGRSRKAELADSQWGPEPSPDARNAARDRWQRRTERNTTMSDHAGRGDINGMSEFPGLMHGAGASLGDAAATVARAAATTDDTPSNQSVKEAARAWAVEAAHLAARGEEIAALSRQADAAGYQAGEQYAATPNKHMWMD